MPAALTVLLLAMLGSAHAENLLGLHDWESGAEGWSSQYGWTSLVDPQSPGGSGNNGGWLQVSFPVTTAPESGQDDWYDIVSVSAASLFAGASEQDMYAGLDLTAQDWMFPGATEDMFLADLAAIDWIGVYMYRQGSGAQLYGIDNFALMVPEPAECAMLAAALVAVGLGVRRRRDRSSAARAAA